MSNFSISFSECSDILFLIQIHEAFPSMGGKPYRKEVLNMQKIHGYRFKGGTAFCVEQILLKAKENIRQAAQEEYHLLLSDEICQLIDDVAMNLRPRPDTSILEAAVEALNRRILEAENFNTGTEYDLRSGVQVIPDDDGYTYFIFTASNPLLETAFASTPGIEDYTVAIQPSETDDNSPTEQPVKWDALEKRYGGSSPILSANLTSQVELDPSLLWIVDKRERAASRARRHLTTILLNRYACGKEIPNNQLLPMMDKALSRLLYEEENGELQRITDELTCILPDYDLAFIQKPPSAKVTEEK